MEPVEAKKQTSAVVQGSSPGSVEATSTESNAASNQPGKALAKTTEEAKVAVQNPEVKQQKKEEKAPVNNMPDLFANMRVKQSETYLEYQKVKPVS